MARSHCPSSRGYEGAMTHDMTGEQFTIESGGYHAVITECGAGLRELAYAGQPLVLSYDADESAPAAFNQLLVPWPNRVDHGRYTFDGSSYQLDISEPDLDCALHGLTRWMSWTPLSQRSDRVSLGCSLLGSTGYPFRLALEVTYVLEASSGLTVQVTAVNAGRRTAPYAHGAHPYLTVGEPIDDCTVRLPGRLVLPVDERMVPLGPTQPVQDTPYDLREGRKLGDQRLDIAFTDLERDSNGRAWVHLTGATRTTSFWLDEAQPWLEVYTADRVPEADRRRGLGVEPMTSPPNAFSSGTDLVRLEPGASYTGAWGIMAG
ncbi:aldose 1-epimerase family protein [Streptomyces sp. NPDC050145]|uniref:aldose 1-epimerase family protein n=1 Tax=Streptomyces sp. NPDC050145 TaxID=3365602 RepID=UPI003787CC65